MVVKGIVIKAVERFEKMIAKVSGLESWVNKTYAPIFLKEVRLELEYIRQSTEECEFERGRDNLFRDLLEKYKKGYCWSSCYKFFSFENQFEYACLRSEIDEILKEDGKFVF